MLSLRASETNLILKCRFEDKDKAKAITGYQWDKQNKYWTYPLNQITLQSILAFFPDIEINSNVNVQIQKIESKRLIENKRRTDLIKGHFGYELKIKQNYLNYNFFEHQTRSFAFFLERNTAIDFSTPGTGKTLVQIALMKYRFELNLINTVLIICPKGIMESVWVNDILKFWANSDFEIPIYILTDSTEKCKIMLKDKYKKSIWIVNFEKTWRIKDSLIHLDPDFVIVDESSRIKNHAAKQSKAIHKFNNAKYRSIMTGTPTPNNLLEIFSQLKFVEPELFGNSFYRFRQNYFYPSGYQGYEWTPKSGTKETIKQIIQPYAISWNKKECLDLPPLTIRNIECELTIEQKRVYNDMAKEMVTIINDNAYTASIVLTKLIRLSQITSGFIQQTDGENFTEFKKNPKFETLKELLAEIPKESKIIIWSIFNHDADYLKQRLGDKAVVYNGQISGKTKAKSLDQFKNDSRVRYIIIHPKSGGMGLNLSNASYSIYYSMNYSYENYAQSRERFNRPGQIHKMTEYRIIAKHTIDEIILNAVENKQKVNDFIRNVKEQL